MHLIGALGPLIDAGPDQGLFLRQPRGPRLRRKTGSVEYRCALLNRFEECVAQEVVPAIRTDCRDRRRRGDRHRRLARRLHGGGGGLPLPVAVPRRRRHERQLRPRGADGVRGHRGLLLLGAAELPAEPRRRRRCSTSCAGGSSSSPTASGRWENPDESWRLAGVLGAKGMPEPGRSLGAGVRPRLADLAARCCRSTSTTWRPEPRRLTPMNVIFLEPGFPANQREFVRALASIGAHVIGVGDRPYEWLDDELKGWLGRLPADRLGHRRGRAGMGGAPGPGADVGRPAGGGDRGARDAGGARARALRHPGHLGAHRLPLPRQGRDEGGAAQGAGCRRRPRPGSPSVAEARGLRRGGGLPGDPEAARRRRRVRAPSAPATPASCARRRGRAGSPTARRWRSRSSSRATRASTTR